VPKLARLIPAMRAHPRALAHIAPNVLELDHLHASLMDLDDDAAWDYVNALNLGAEWRGAVEALARRSGAWIADEGVAARMVQCLPWVGGFWLKAGSRGMLRLSLGQEPGQKGGVAHRTPDGRTLALTHYPPPAIAADEVLNTTGAGDTLVGGIVAGLLGGAAEADFVAAALERVGRTLRSPLAVA
jgi:pseudouridine-5'-phosphate glycosidase/pseudouridine kinase